MATTRPLAERLWEKVDKRGPDECWPWKGVHHNHGYGQVGYRKRMRYAHRVAWELTFGPIPTGQCVLHRCDVRDCINPAHLFLGTKRDNTQDMIRKGRGMTGLRAHHAKLTEEQVISIRADRRTSKAIALEYPVTARHIRKLKRGQHWIKETDHDHHYDHR